MIRDGAEDCADDGFATVWAAVASTAMLIIATVIVGFGTAAITRNRAESAADLAALAGAAHVVSGAAYACDRARWVAERMRVGVTDCRVVGWEVTVATEATLPGPLVGLGPARGLARAGPLDR